MASGDGGLDWLGVDGVVVEAIMGYLGIQKRPSKVSLHYEFLPWLLPDGSARAASLMAWVPGVRRRLPRSGGCRR